MKCRFCSWAEFFTCVVLQPFVVSGCSQNENFPIDLSFDNESPIEVQLDKYNYVNILDVGRIDKVDCFSDEIAVIASNRLLLTSSDGSNQLFVSNVGRTKEEYLGIWDAGFMPDGKVYLYDLSGSKIMFFKVDGSLVGTQSLDRSASNNPFQVFAPAGTRHYIGRCSFDGIDGCPELALYDKDFSFVRYIDEKISLNSGLLLGFPFGRTSSDAVLYVRNFSNDVYKVSRDTAHVKYVIDFKKYTYKRPSSKGDYEISSDLQDCKRKYALVYSDFEEVSDDYFAFSFLFPGERRVGLYDMKCGSCSVFSFKCREDEVLAYVRTFKGKLIIVTQTEDGKTRLYRIPVGDC